MQHANSELGAYSPLPFGSPDININNQNTSYNLNASSQSGATDGFPNWDFFQEQPIMDLLSAPDIHVANPVVENNSEGPSMPNMPASGANSQLKNVMKPQTPQSADASLGELLTLNEPPYNVASHPGSSRTDPAGMILLTVPEFDVEVPRSMSVDCWKGEIHKKLDVILDDMINIKLPIAGKVTASNKRAMQNILSDSEEHHTLKRKKLQGAIENYFSYDTGTNFAEEPHDSIGISTGIKSFASAPSDEVPLVRNQTASGVIQKTTSIALSPQVEAQNADSMLQVSESSQRRKRRIFSPDEIKLLIDAVEKYRIGSWQEIKEKDFHASDRTSNELKIKWRSLVETAKRPAGNRRGRTVLQELLDEVLCITARDEKLRKPL